MDPIPMLDVDPERFLRTCVPLFRWVERNPLFLAVLEDDLETLKNLLGSDKSSVNVENAKGLSLLNSVIYQKRVNIFDYLLSLEQTDINYVDSSYGTPLICVAFNFDENFALKLMEKGADIHKTDNRGNTFLHIAAQMGSSSNLAIGKLVIEKGIDINHQASSSYTPLHDACRYKNVEWIHMLLYYGADATIYNDEGVLPLTLLLTRSNATSSNVPDKELVVNILFNYTFDVGDSVPLKVLFALMCNHSPDFCKMLDYIPHPIYDEEDLEYMANELINVDSENLKQFFEKFKFVVKELFENFPVLNILVKNIRSYFYYAKHDKVKEIIETVLRSEFVEEFVQSSTDDSVISVFVELYSEDELIGLTEITCLMLSYGLRVTSADLDAVYDRYGFCELFKILLHMDIETNIFLESSKHKHLLAAIFYHPQMTIENMLERVMLYPDLLLYFNNPKLKEYITGAPGRGEIPIFSKTLPRLSFLENLVRKNEFGSRGVPYQVGKSVVIYTCEDEVEEKVKQLPQVPYLVELSRNAARQYIIERFSVKNCRQFYTVIQCLPISRIHKEIISLERMLY